MCVCIYLYNLYVFPHSNFIEYFYDDSEGERGPNLKLDF